VKPILACSVTDFDRIRFPVLATPKIDGVRCLVHEGRALARSLKRIPNDHIRNTLERDLAHLPLDGELWVTGAQTFGEVSGPCMRQSGEPDFRYLVFDLVLPGVPYEDRVAFLQELSREGELPGYVQVLAPELVTGVEALMELHEQYLRLGHEGTMFRQPDSPYKFGRSTEREGYLMRIKPFEDAEAEVVGFEEQMRNENALEKNELGYAKRSSRRAGKVPAGRLGKLICRIGEVEFSIGTGFTDAQREEIWNNQSEYLSLTVKFKHQALGAKSKPRIPVFLGFRAKEDMS